MKYGIFAFILVFAIRAVPAAAFESFEPKAAESNQHDLQIELEPVPAPLQENFDRYVQDLAVTAQRDARHEEASRDEQLAKAQKLKVVNPIVLFRW
jgi:hypothetical protein